MSGIPMTHAVSMDTPTFPLRPAAAMDAAAVRACVIASYKHYIARIGKPPGPMSEDYAALIQQRKVSVVEIDNAIVGVIVLSVTEEGLLLDNVAVEPSSRGKGLGKFLLGFAETEARRQGCHSIYLYTHEMMTENQSLYAKFGYVEYDRRVEMGFTRVYMSKRLS